MTVRILRLCLVYLLLTTFCSHSLAAPADETAPAPATSAGAALDPARKPITWQFSDEQEWLVDSTGRDVAEMLLFAKYHTEAPARLAPESIEFLTTTVDKAAGKYKYQLLDEHLKDSIVRDFDLQEYAWSPSNYQPFAQDLITKFGLQADPASEPPADFLAKLGDATMDSLINESNRVSAALSEHPLDPSLHEQAALIQAAFHLRECSASFSDTRPPLSRISAHLAIARALRGNNGGGNMFDQLADIALECLSCRDGIAVSKISAIEKQQSDPIVQSWLRGIKIRASGDFRLFPGKNFTALEETQYGLRLASHRNADTILDYIRTLRPKPMICWMRLGMLGRMSVGSGHFFNAHILPVEMDDFYKDYALHKKQKFGDLNLLSSELNRKPTRCLTLDDGSPKLVPLSWDDIAASHSRQIMAAVQSEYYYYNNMFGDPEQAKNTLDKTWKLLSNVTLYPFALGRADLNEQRTIEYFQKTNQAISHHPELITPIIWWQVIKRSKHPNQKAEVVSSDLWYSPMMPMGTAYFFGGRYDFLDNSKLDLATLTRCRAVCPSDRRVCDIWTEKKYGKTPTAEQLEEGYGPLLAFDIGAMQKVAEADSKFPAKYEARLLKIAKLWPSTYFVLGDEAVEQKQPLKAAQYYEKAVELCQDPVAVANKTGWLINYWYDHGQKPKAIALAQEGAEVYSHIGLENQAKLFERMGNLNQAEENYIKIKDRYEAEEDLMNFYRRNAAKSKRYATEAARLTKKVFPTGMKPVTLAQLKAPPVAGILVESAPDDLKLAGLKEHTIVVGMNGFLIENQVQYHAVRRLPSGRPEHLQILFWDGAKYKETFKKSRDNLLGIRMSDYKAKSAAK